MMHKVIIIFANVVQQLVRGIQNSVLHIQKLLWIPRTSCGTTLVGSAVLVLGCGIFINAHAELRDPTRPPGFIKSGSGFVTGWQLNGVIISSDRKVAIINGQAIKIGEQIEGSQLVDIEPNSVQLQGVDGKITLFLLDSSLNVKPLTN